MNREDMTDSQLECDEARREPAMLADVMMPWMPGNFDVGREWAEYRYDSFLQYRRSQRVTEE